MILSAIYDEPAEGLMGWTRNISRVIETVERSALTCADALTPTRRDRDRPFRSESELPDDIQ